jgi:hypothetical protein
MRVDTKCGKGTTGTTDYRRAILSFLLFALIAIVAAPFVAAQSTGGRIRGTVTDPSGAVIAATKVTLINEATNIARETQTDSSGDYLFLEVPVGSYDIGVSQSGFKKYARKGIQLNLNEVVTVDITLQLGMSAETVEVTGQALVVDTSSTQLGAIVNDRSSTQLPLNQRDIYQLLQLQPGVQSQLGNDLFFGSDKAGVVTVNGGRGRSNNYTVNGGDANDLFVNGPAIEPSPDSVDEFRVITNSFDAEYGRNSGAVVNVVTKSGTNTLHGSAYEFFRNDVLNARAFTFTPAPKPPFKQNQFGATLGGPIKKDKTFIFGSYEGRRIVRGIDSQPVAVPTAAELANGDFSSEATFSGGITSPTVAGMLNGRTGCATAVAAAGGAPIAVGNTFDLIFPSNQIPTQCFDPVAVSLLNLYVVGASGTTTPVITVPKNRDRGDQFQIRVDHSLTGSQRLAVYYYFDDDNSLDPFAKFQSFGDPQGEFPSIYATRTQQANVSHTWTIGTSAVNEARFNYFREGQLKFNTPTRTNPITASCGTGAAAAFCFTGTSDSLTINTACAAGTVSTADCGIHTGLPKPGSVEGVPAVTIGGTGLLIGNNSGGQLPQIGNSFQFTDNYSKVIGNHSLKFGGDVRYQKFDQFLIFDINGSYTFQSGGTGNISATDAYPNFFLGLASSYLQGSAQHELVRSTSTYLFAQDSWKIKPSLTLNYGLRWEFNTPLTDAGKKVQAFRPGQASTIYPGIPGNDAAGVTPLGIIFPGDKGVPNGLTQTYYKAFAPRLGLNWSPGWREGLLGKLTGGPGKTSVSMGYGIFYNPIEQLVLEQFSAEPPFGGSESILGTFLQTPFVDQTGTVHPNPFNGVLSPPRGQPLDWSRFLGTTYFGDFQPHMRQQYSAQYNLTIKRELPGNILIQVGYVGSQAHRLLAIYEVNETVNRPGGVNTCLEMNTIVGPDTCGPFGEDTSYSFMLGPSQSIDLPYYTPGGAAATGPNVPCLPVHTPAPCHFTNATAAPVPITLSGLRFYSSPFCNPLSGAGCPSTPPIVGIFAEDTVAKSNYNSLQALVEKRFSHGLQFQASYTFSKTMDNASSFEDALNPFNFNATYGLSKYDARHRFVFNYVWELPVPKYSGFKGQVLDGWEVSGILTLQSGFPIRITSQADNELLDSTFNFEAPGEPNVVAQFKTVNPRKTVCDFGTGPLAPGAPPCSPVSGFVFDPNLFDNSCAQVALVSTCAPGSNPVQLGAIGNAPRSICCGPGILNTDMSFSKSTPIGEKFHIEFRADIFNIWNHAQFLSVDGNVGNQGATFGRPLKVRDPRLVQFAIKFRF